MTLRHAGRTARATALALLAATLAAAPGAHADGASPPDGMVLVPAGEFWMGRTRLWLTDEIGWQLRGRADDRPVHRVELDAFYLDAVEVTNESYARFVSETGAGPPYQWGGANPPDDTRRLPVYNVSWHEALAYCTWSGRRLPTEAEWERAARGGLEDQDYPWGNSYTTDPPDAPAESATAAEGTSGAAEPEPIRHAHSDSALGPVTVASFEPNAFGLYDMSGNVWEWVADWYDLHYYGVSPVANPTGPETGLYKVIRGGSWADDEIRLGAVYYRNFTAPDLRSPTIGFRCALTAPGR